MAGLFFESGIDDGFEKDLNRLNKKLNEFAANAARQSKNIEEAGKNGFGWTVGAQKRFDALGNGIDDSMARGTASLNQFAQNGVKQTDKLGQSINRVGGLLAGYFGAQTLVTFGKDVVNTIAKFEKYGIILENTLGSKGKAEEAMRMVKEFAASTPFSVDELTDSFVRLANQGFKPTKEQMTSLGDLASSTGKSFTQLAEALIDAQTGEFERLKEFGIKAKKEGDNLTFTFKGQTTAVENNAEAIRAYVLSLGELQGVAGANAKIAESLTGQISNLGDSWDAFMLSLEGGNGIVSKTVSTIISLISGLVSLQTTLNEGGTGIAKKFFGAEEQYQKLLKQQSLIISKITDEKAKENYINNEIIKKTTKMKMVELELNKVRSSGQNAAIKEKNTVKLKLELEAYQRLLAQLNEFKEAGKTAPAFTPPKVLTDKEKKELQAAYDRSIKDFQNYLSTQEKDYEAYNRDIEKLSGDRKKIVENEYKGLIENGKTYLDFLNNLLAKEKDAKKQEIIKQEITTVTSSNTIQAQKDKEEQLKIESDKLKELLKTYATYEDKRKEIEEKGLNEIKILRENNREEQALQAEKALQDELTALDQSILKSNALFQSWLDSSLPAIVKNGVSAIQAELNTLTLQLQTGNLDPEQVIVYKAKIEELNKALANKSDIEKDSETKWKDTLEIINGVNDLAKDLISSFDGLNESTKQTLTGIVNIGSGVVNLVTGFKAVGAAVSGIEKASAILALISAGVKVVSAVIGIFTKKRKERIEAEKKELERLKQVYEDFGASISSTFGSAASEITKAFQTMYEGGADAMSSLEQSFSDMIESFTNQAIQAAYLQPYINQVNEVTKQLGVKYASGEISAQELQSGVLGSLSQFYNTIRELQPQILQAYKNADEMAAKIGFESAFNAQQTEAKTTQLQTQTTPTEPTTPQAQQVQQQISAESESILLGRLGSIMMSNQELVNQGIDTLDYAIQNLLYMKQIKINTDYLPEIAENTKKTYQKLETI